MFRKIVAAFAILFGFGLTTLATPAFADPVVSFGNYTREVGNIGVFANTDPGFGSDLTIVIGSNFGLDLFADQSGTPLQVFLNGDCLTCL